METFDQGGDNSLSLVLVTKSGRIKRSAISEYRLLGATGVPDFRLSNGDRVVSAFLSSMSDDIVFVTSDAKGLRIEGSEVRPTGRATQGVAGVGLASGAWVIASGACPPSGTEGATGLFTLSATGHGKRTAIGELPAKGRGTGGVLVAPNGTVLAAASVHPHNATVLVRTKEGNVTRIAPTQVPLQARTGRGIPLVSISADDPVVAVIAMPGGA